MRSSVSGASLTGRARYSYSSIVSEISSITVSDAASQPSTGSKLVSAIENAVCRTLPGSAAATAKLRNSKAAAAAGRAKRKGAPAAVAAFPVETQRYNRSIPDSFSGELMGKGDVRTRRGKIFNHSYGKKRRHKQKQAR